MLTEIRKLFNLEKYEMKEVESHEGGRNWIFLCENEGKYRFAIRISLTGDRREEEYLAETEFVHYLAANGGAVTDVFPSVNGKLVEQTVYDGRKAFISCFAYAKGMLISDNGYRYREGAPLSEYFYNTGKTLGKIHQLAKEYVPRHKRADYFDKYNMEYLNELISDKYKDLKKAIAKRLETFALFSKESDVYGLVHFDYSDGNYHIDMETGNITVFDFDNCMYCWYMFDLANLWTHGEGWCRSIRDGNERMAYMKHYFDTILAGYRTETDISEEMLTQLPLFIDMVLIENIVDEFECCARDGELPDDEEIQDASEYLIKRIPYAGIGMTTTD